MSVVCKIPRLMVSGKLSGVHICNLNFFLDSWLLCMSCNGLEVICHGSVVGEG